MSRYVMRETSTLLFTGSLVLVVGITFVSAAVFLRADQKDAALLRPVLFLAGVGTLWLGWRTLLVPARSLELQAGGTLQVIGFGWQRTIPPEVVRAIRFSTPPVRVEGVEAREIHLDHRPLPTSGAWLLQALLPTTRTVLLYFPAYWRVTLEVRARNAQIVVQSPPDWMD